MDRRFLAIYLIFLIWTGWYIYTDAQNQKVEREKKLAAQQAAEAAEGEADSADAKLADDAPPKAAEPEAPLVENLTLGNDETGPNSPYYLEANLTSRGAAIREMFLNRFVDERLKDRLKVLTDETLGEFSYLLTVKADEKTKKKGEPAEESLARKNWNVIAQSPEEVAFQTTARGGKIQITKRYLLEKGSKTIRLVLELNNLSDEPIKNVIYTLSGGSGVPLEGEWYTTYYRNAQFLLRSPDNPRGDLREEPATNVVYNHENESPQASFSRSPVQWAGVSARYFFSGVIQPIDLSASPEKSQIAEASTAFLSRHPLGPEYSNIGVQLRSSAMTLAPDQPARHEFLLFNGPKDEAVLGEFAEYQLPKSIHFPPVMFIPDVGISALLTWILENCYKLVGDYGVAIVVLTVMVRLFLMPLNIWQMRTMTRMQAIQPEMERIRNEVGDDMQEYGRRIRELQAEHKVNPYMGCLPAFLQLPILAGLWQALATDFHLRQAPLFYGWTWVKDLSAPDMLFRWGDGIPLISSLLGPYFNLLPIISLFQLILVMLYSAPPPTNQEAKVMRSVMIGMMVFMSFMFYKVPSGLCVYIITGSLWGMAERKLIPKPPVPKELAMMSERAKESVARSNSVIDATWRKPVESKKKR
jgi:YidC/Oxa1 family membrane protein insertase